MKAVHQNNLNLLRLLLASAVIVGHSSELIDGNDNREPLHRLFGTTTLGALAVDGFFLLSGYLIAMSWQANPLFFPYLRKRAVRILPGFLVASCLSGLLLGPFAGNLSYWLDFNAVSFVASLLTLTSPKTPPVFPGLIFHNINGPLWTIRYEFGCYLLIPLLGVSGVLLRRHAVLTLAAALTLWAMAQEAGLVRPIFIGLRWDHVVPRLPCFFLIGTTFYLFRDRVRYDLTTGLIAAVLLVMTLFNPVLSTFSIPVLGGYLLLGVGLAPPLPFTSAVRRVDLSYGVYLYAWPIQQFIIANWLQINPWLLSAITLPMAFLAGLTSWELVERPAMKWNSRKSYRQQGCQERMAPG